MKLMVELSSTNNPTASRKRMAMARKIRLFVFSFVDRKPRKPARFACARAQYNLADLRWALQKGAPLQDMRLNITDDTLKFYKEHLREPHQRYRSWEHCYYHFQQWRKFKSENDFDIAALHLAFYLASWGMYRGSSPILQRDYKIHIPVIRALVSQKYQPLWQLDFESISLDGIEIELVFELAQDIQKALGQNDINKPTPALITKIIMGTIGCTPAYDRFFVEGVKSLGEFPASFKHKGYRGVIQFYQDNAKEFRKAQSIISKGRVEYPPMKLVDMYFWSLGVQGNQKRNR